MKKIVLHGGPPKTGSSAIQAWLLENRSYLLEQGIYYPAHLVDKNQISSGSLLSVASPSEGKYRVDEKKIAELLQNFEKSNCTTLLLSSEFFYLLIDDLARILDKFKLILYLRDPVEQYQSGYNQRVKRTSEVLPLSPPLNLKFRQLRRFREISENFANIELEIRPYADIFFPNGDVISDFLSALDLPCREVKAKRVNSSYTFEAMEFKRSLNCLPLDTVQAELDMTLQSCELGTKNYSLIEPTVYRKIRAQLLRDLSDLNQSYRNKELDKFYLYMSSVEQKKYYPQALSAHQLLPIANYINAINPELYSEIRSILESNSRLELPNNNLYSVFDIDRKV